MISAFKHIRLSGYNLTPTIEGSELRLGFNNSGFAYYSELTGVSGYLQGLINTANADVSNLNNLQGNLYITGGDGVTIQVDANLGEIKVVGNSGYFQNIINNLSSASSNALNASGTIYYDTFATKTSLFETGSVLTNRVDSLSGYVNSQDTLIRSEISSTGSILDTKINTVSGYANATYVAKSSNQVFTKDLSPTNLDAYAVIYPVPFATPPKIQATLEVPGDVMYNLSIRSINEIGYTGLLSDNILEAGARIHTFASTQ